MQKEVSLTLLRYNFWFPVVLVLVIVALFESDILPSGLLADDKKQDFLWSVLMELLTICSVPVALRLFKFSIVRHKVEVEETADFCAYTRWALIRMNMLVVPMLGNCLLYYLFMNVAFGYMGIILLLSLCFIYPSRFRILAETTKS